MVKNLDMECAKLGARIGTQSDDRTLTDALSVLEEQGVYAFFLFLKNERPVTDSCRAFLKDHLPGGFGSSENDVFKATQEIATDIDKLLLARDLLRQSLIYGRYHAKGGGSGAQR
mgnify:CR=1 FL=1